MYFKWTKHTYNNNTSDIFTNYTLLLYLLEYGIVEDISYLPSARNIISNKMTSLWSDDTSPVALIMF